MTFATLVALTLLTPGASTPSGTPEPPLDDATIVAILDAANGFDIETGTLAAGKGWSREVRAVGASLVRDHQGVQQQARELARKLGVTPTPPAVHPFAAQHAAALKDLTSRSGAAFDRAFLDHEIAYHQAVLDAVTQTILPAIRNAELKAFVEGIAPAFQAHLDMCKAARAQLGS